MRKITAGREKSPIQTSQQHYRATQELNEGQKELKPSQRPCSPQQSDRNAQGEPNLKGSRICFRKTNETIYKVPLRFGMRLVRISIPLQIQGKTINNQPPVNPQKIKRYSASINKFDLLFYKFISLILSTITDKGHYELGSNSRSFNHIDYIAVSLQTNQRKQQDFGYYRSHRQYMSLIPGLLERRQTSNPMKNH